MAISYKSNFWQHLVKIVLENSGRPNTKYLAKYSVEAEYLVSQYSVFPTKNYTSILSGWLVDLSLANTRTTTNNSLVERTAKRSSVAPSLKKTSPTSPMT